MANDMRSLNLIYKFKNSLDICFHKILIANILKLSLFHGYRYSYESILDYVTVQSGRWVSTFRRNKVPSSSKQKWEIQEEGRPEVWRKDRRGRLNPAMGKRKWVLWWACVMQHDRRTTAAKTKTYVPNSGWSVLLSTLSVTFYTLRSAGTKRRVLCEVPTNISEDRAVPISIPDAGDILSQADYSTLIVIPEEY
jgi:hypothetical protein